MRRAACTLFHFSLLTWVYASDTLDTFSEALHLRLVPFSQSPRLFLARFEFNIEAALSSSFRTDQFDLFPKSIGKLLNAHRAIAGFEATLTQGRWKEEWGAPPREFRPPGALLVAATNSTRTSEADEAWKFLTSALSGSLCASFEGMDPDREAASWSRPLGVPWAEHGRALRFSSLPYETVCTENLTPWLKLLPCGQHRGLPAFLAPLAIAESPLVSLSLAVSVHENGGTAQLRASLDVVLPMQTEKKGFAAWFSSDKFSSCPAASQSQVHLWSNGMPGSAELDEARAEALDLAPSGGHGVVLSIPTATFGSIQDTSSLPLPESALAKPWEATDSDGRGTSANGVSVMRDILSQEGKSERTHGRYLLRFTNAASVKARRVRFMDQMPFFIRPMWHTFRVTLSQPGQQIRELHGLEAMQYLELQFVPSEGRLPTDVFLNVDVLPGATVSVFLDVSKSFIQLREFSYACEKGFDTGSAAWLELELEAGSTTGSHVSSADFIESLAPARPFGAAARRGTWRLRFTQGLIVLLPMPDFSMPFNVIALSSTAVTFFFGSLFRFTAAGRMPHWVLKKDEEPNRKGLAFFIKRLLLATLVAGAYGLYVAEPGQIKDLRQQLPAEIAGYVVDTLESLKETMDKVGR